MAKATKKVTLSPSRDLLFDKLVPSQASVRHNKTDVSVEELVEDIAHRGFLRS
jgi:ParB family transcriptional regulator, chromosome partitioning protein